MSIQDPGEKVEPRFVVRRLFRAPVHECPALFHSHGLGPPPTFAMGFKVPECVETDAWGPPVDYVDADRALTYAPFTRSDKFGRGETLRPST